MYSVRRELSFRGEFSVITLKGAILTQPVTTLTSWLRADSKITGCVLNRGGILLFGGRGGRRREGRRRGRRCRGFEKKSTGFQLPGEWALLGEASVGQREVTRDPLDLQWFQEGLEIL